ncbi:MAG: RlmE family RNA methyltransferase [Alphaproteobacteria bacterium]|nr:RlmE family RNA methyltransferase [Alphaproteobacteria bacterium]MBL0717674.1 RlmE family RNA methyltransferase [Alphaproteobacteria bacterium]
MIQRLNSNKIKKSNSSSQWMRRHLNDHFVKKANKLNYRSRAVFKLEEIQDKFHILKDNQTIIDLGVSPGGWSQWILQNQQNSSVLAVDLIDCEPFSNRVKFYKGDFTDKKTQEWLVDKSGGKVNIILSDIAPNTTGNHKVDALKMSVILEDIISFSDDFLLPGGHLVMKSFMSNFDAQLSKLLKEKFKMVKHFKPKSSRKESPEIYIIAISKKKS